MRIAYDHYTFTSQRFGGISRYFVELASRLAAREDCDVTVLAMLHFNAYVRALPPSIARGVHVPHLRYTGRVRQVASGVAAALWMRALRPDVVHETYLLRMRLAPRRSRVAVTVMDMTHERFPRLFSPIDRTRGAKAAAVGRADRVIVPSLSTRRDLVEILGTPEEKIDVVNLAGSLDRVPGTALPPAVRPPYVLYVGQRDEYKNFGTLVRAFGASAALTSGVQLVCAGGGPFNGAEREALRTAGMPQGAALQLTADDATLAELYARAAAFVYPSLYEGFGIPLVEAMRLGCPVVCSDTSSLPEVAADAAELVPPTSPEALADALERVVGGNGHAEAMRARGRTRARCFSWDRCAAETYAVYRRMLDDPPPAR